MSIYQVPRIFIGKESVGGSSDLWTLHNNGKLLPMLKTAGLTIEATPTPTPTPTSSGDTKKDN